MVDKLKPAKLDSNVWYHLTEGRVDKAGKKFGSMLQADNVTQELKVWVRNRISSRTPPMQTNHSQHPNANPNQHHYSLHSSANPC